MSAPASSSPLSEGPSEADEGQTSTFSDAPSTPAPFTPKKQKGGLHVPGINMHDLQIQQSPVGLARPHTPASGLTSPDSPATKLKKRTSMSPRPPSSAERASSSSAAGPASADQISQRQHRWSQDATPASSVQPFKLALDVPVVDQPPSKPDVQKSQDEAAALTRSWQQRLEQEQEEAAAAEATEKKADVE